MTLHVTLHVQRTTHFSWARDVSVIRVMSREVLRCAQ